MTTIEVFADRRGRALLVGQAHFTEGRRGEVSTTFVYAPDYLVGGGMNVDPALLPTSGPQHQRGLLRAFADSAPDRWGRGLLDKAERARAREEGRAPRPLGDLDYLIGVSDDARQGALRFRRPGEDDFLGPPSRVPRLVALPRLLRASDELAADDDHADAVKQLLDTGTTGLGGARPKASVRLEDGALAIAKLPHSSDRWDVMAWEATALDLLAAAGVRVPEHRIARVGGRSVLLLRRFDRAGDGVRLGYISAMTATGSDDGDHRDYADVAVAVRDLSLSPRSDHRELYDRVVANVALGNTDDHLRNHGFLAERRSWTLSPAFDVNPNPDAAQSRATSIAGADALPDEAEALIALAEDCGLPLPEAKERMLRVIGSLSGWQERARANGAPEREVAMMAGSIRPRLEAVARAAGSAP